jgi:hypothetical protein
VSSRDCRQWTNSRSARTTFKTAPSRTRGSVAVEPAPEPARLTAGGALPARPPSTRPQSRGAVRVDRAACVTVLPAVTRCAAGGRACHVGADPQPFVPPWRPPACSWPRVKGVGSASGRAALSRSCHGRSTMHPPPNGCLPPPSRVVREHRITVPRAAERKWGSAPRHRCSPARPRGARLRWSPASGLTQCAAPDHRATWHGTK